MQGKVTEIAFHRAKPGKERALREALLAVRGPTLKEKGCINYDLHESPSLPGVFVFLENWESKGTSTPTSPRRISTPFAPKRLTFSQSLPT